jgi:ADP-heptose:LPS heptosyltransferase
MTDMTDTNGLPLRTTSARRHVLAVRADSLGDVVVTGPAVRAIAASGARVTMLCSPQGAPAWSRLPGVAEVVVERLPWIDADPQPVERAAMEGLVDRLATHGFDEAIIFTSFHQSALPLALVARMAGIPLVAAISVDYPGSLLDVRHHVSDDLHEVERALSLVATLGYRLSPGDDGRLAIRRLRRVERPRRLPDGEYVVVHPGSAAPARTWTPDRFVALVTALTARGWRVAVTGAPSERALTAHVAGSQPGAHDLGGLRDLDDLIDVLGHASAVVVGNTGPAHLSAALGVPVVSLFAPTVSSRAWHPWGVPHVLLGMQDIECAGCRARVCPRGGHPCLTSVPIDDAVAAVEILTSRGRTRSTRDTSEVAS